MSTSPFMTPSDRRRRREAASRRRRHRRRGLLAGVIVLALATAVVVMAFGGGGAAHESAPAIGAVGAKTHQSPAAPSPRPASSPSSSPPGASSPLGLPLGKPALALKGITGTEQEPIRAPFHKQPRAGLLFNLDTGQVLWERNPYARLPVASLTKMMTALLTVTSAPPDAPVLVTKEAVAMAGSKLGVLPLGRRVKLESLLYGLLLPSGNDAAVALAQHVAGSVNKFVAAMNLEAAKLGMGCSHYSSPSGYYDRGNFSCAADLALLAHDDLQQPRIASVVRTYSAVLPFPIKGGKLYLYNNNPLLIYGYPGTTGMKTGQTEAAGRCLVATAERNGVRLGVVLLHSPEPGRQAAYLLSHGFETVYHQPRVRSPAMPPGA